MRVLVESKPKIRFDHTDQNQFILAQYYKKHFCDDIKIQKISHSPLFSVKNLFHYKLEKSLRGKLDKQIYSPSNISLHYTGYHFFH